ncbi:hypothetical protein [Sphingomonas baiyangensis]|uniref:Uncharacterized protein n=1 Tax=Sphingomonas baiyangensis TaxID=2572576 RepID=A0A4U1L317_9SPHN|nr:hypothetical protein [Sphingomonas baiyangensis]TKD51291.1 hypothetical protein FBR43_11390 [Sphingomonas baiyangensis]
MASAPRPRYLLAISLLLAGCADQPVADELAGLDAALIAGADANAADPAAMAALNDPIMVDPYLSTRSNADALRPPTLPYTGAVPHPGIAGIEGDLESAGPPAAIEQAGAARPDAITFAALAGALPGGAGPCAARLAYSAAYANRLPAGLALPAPARVIEAAGVDDAGCALRAVGFYIAQPADRVAGWYAARTKGAGYTVEHRRDGDTQVLNGARARDDAAYALFLTPRADGGTDVEMVARNGA